MILLVGVLMLTAYLAPLWQITLSAPQYPEGLALFVWISNLTGGQTHDIQNINILNHYIGMKEINPHSIPELVYMPYVLGYMIFGAFVTFLIPRVFMIVLGIVNMILVMIVGMTDFYIWGYNYGHNLSPDAPISMPGMTYQPPLLFCKTILNISACSYPHVGAILILVGFGILIYILVMERAMYIKNRIEE